MNGASSKKNKDKKLKKVKNKRNNGSENDVTMRMRLQTRLRMQVHAMPSLTSLSPSFNPLPPHSPLTWSLFVLLPCRQEFGRRKMTFKWLNCKKLGCRDLVVRDLFSRKGSVVKTRS